MKLDHHNLYISKHDNGYAVFIEMPDNTRNFLHNKPVNTIAAAVKILNDFNNGNKLLGYGNTNVYPNDEYYRIVVTLKDEAGDLQTFHSRNLNVIDAAKEFEMLVT